MHGRASGLSTGDGLRRADSFPYVLFGKNSSKQMLDAVEKGLSTPGGDLRSTSIGEHGTNFMVNNLIWLIRTKNKTICLRLRLQRHV